MPLTVSGSLKAVREAAARIADLERQVGEERIGRVRFREAIHEALKACDESSFASIEDTLKAAISCDGEIPALYPDIETEVLTLRERTHSLERQLAAKSTLDQTVIFPPVAEPPFVIADDTAPSPPPSADEAWMEAAWRTFQNLTRNSPDTMLKDDFFDTLRRHVPAPRYPEVCEFLDAIEGRAWYVSCSMLSPPERRFCLSIIGSNYFGPDLASACRAALDAKERADG